MPEKFDFSKIEDQQRFESLPEKEKDKIVDEAQEEAEVENLEKELSPEAIEKIMDKVQDIDAEGTAYSVLGKSIREKDQLFKNLDGVFKNGLLATETPEGTIKPEEWVKNIRKHKDAGYFFNIVGRETDIGEDGLLPRMNYAHYFGIRYGAPREPAIAAIFDSRVLKEDQPYIYKKGENQNFKTRTFRANQYFDYGGEIAGGGNYDEIPKEFTFDLKKKITADTDFGFLGTYRLPPRLIKGIVYRPEIENIGNYADHNKVEQFKKKHYGLGPDHTYLEKMISRKNFEIDEELNEKIDLDVKKIVYIMLSQYRNKKQLLLPIYDFLGNLRWPIKMSYEEVKKFVAERDKKKEEKPLK